MARKTFKQRLKQKIWNRGERVCWPWLAYIDKKGYAKVWYNGRPTTAHSIVWALKNGPVPEGLRVLSCPIIKDCMNVNHMGLGTNADIEDRTLWKKGLKRKIYSPKRIKKVSDEIARQIFLSDERGIDLAEKYHITKQYVSHIRNRRKCIRATQHLVREDVVGFSEKVLI